MLHLPLSAQTQSEAIDSYSHHRNASIQIGGVTFWYICPWMPRTDTQWITLWDPKLLSKFGELQTSCSLICFAILHVFLPKGIISHTTKNNIWSSEFVFFSELNHKVDQPLFVIFHFPKSERRGRGRMRGRGTHRKNPLSNFEFNSGTLGLEQSIEVIQLRIQNTWEFVVIQQFIPYDTNRAEFFPVPLLNCVFSSPSMTCSYSSTMCTNKYVSECFRVSLLNQASHKYE